jgi:O-antigen/teichoic acid export membrane protein
MSGFHGNVSAAKRSLNHFVIGRLASALVGVITLLLFVRAFEREEYGVYIALWAAFEIIQLAASPGAYAVVFRYLPELRSADAGHELARMTLCLMVYRIVTLAAVATIIWLTSDLIAGFAGSPQAAAALAIYALILVFEGTARFNDAIFESLLRQGAAQVSVLVRNGLRLLALYLFTEFGNKEIPLVQWLGIEAVTTAFGSVFSATLLGRQIFPDRHRGRDALRKVTIPRIMKFSVPTYVSQVVYLSSGVEMVKLLVSKLLGFTATASFGFSAALAGTIQRYLPSFLLIGWVRPLFIAAKEQGKHHGELVSLAGTVTKLNLLMLAPISVVMLVGGEVIFNWLTDGRLPDSLPFFHFFLLLLVFQTIRAVISLLGTTLEIGSGSLYATLVSIVGLVFGLSFFNFIGLWSLCIGLLVSEVAWAFVMVMHLKARDMLYRLPTVCCSEVRFKCFRFLAFW